MSFAPWGYIGVLIGFAVWATLIIVGTSNAVNLTDGLDGLASGSTILVFVAYVMITFWQFNQSCFRVFPDQENFYKCYEVRDSLELTAVAAMVSASLIGFLWWNTSPAKIFMGDTGSAGSWWRGGSTGVVLTHRASVAHRGRAFCGLDRFGDYPAPVFQGHRGSQSPLLLAVASPLRNQRVGRSHYRGALLVDRRALCRGRGGVVLPGVAWSLSTLNQPDRRSWHAQWSGQRVVVVGLGLTGFSVVDTLVELGCDVLAVAAQATPERVALTEVIGSLSARERARTPPGRGGREFCA